jgi:hypothetical protein
MEGGSSRTRVCSQNCSSNRILRGLQKSLQAEWQFVKRVVDGIGDCFGKVSAEIFNNFLPALFGKTFDDDDPRKKLTMLLINHAGMALLPNPVNSTKTKFPMEHPDDRTLDCSPLRLMGLSV